MKNLIAAALVSLALVGSASASTTVFSDNFDSYGGQLGVTSLGSNWNVVGQGTVDVIPWQGNFVWYGTGGYVDLNGTPDGAARLESASFNTTVGQEYKVSFDYGKNKYSGSDKTFSFGLVGGTLLPSLLLAGPIENLISTFFTFVATDVSSKIFFADLTRSPSDSGGPIIDNVIVASVPIPAAGLLLFGALAGLAGFSRLRRNRSLV